MGRKNRKGRTPRQNPRLFYRTRRHADRRGQHWSDADLADDAGLPPQEWESARRRRRRRRSGAADAVREASTRHLEPEMLRDAEPAPLWLIDAADVRSLPHPAPPAPEAPNDQPRLAVCGNCREWIPPADPHATDRGRCIHPASGVSRPPFEFEACAFFN